MNSIRKKYQIKFLIPKNSTCLSNYFMKYKILFYDRTLIKFCVNINHGGERQVFYEIWMLKL